MRRGDGKERFARGETILVSCMTIPACPRAQAEFGTHETGTVSPPGGSRYDEGMTAWRRTLKSWPKETARTADPASLLPEWLRVAPADAGNEPTADQMAWRITFVFLAPTLTALLVAWVLKSWIGPFAFAAMLVAGFLVSLVTGQSSLNALLRRLDRRRMRRTLDALTERGEPTLGGEAVGVAYADGFWTYPHRGDRDADLGVVRFDFDRLSFVGMDTRFELPAAAIVGTEIRRISWGLGVRANVYVHWREGDRSGTFSLGLPCDAPGRHVRATLALRERIEAWRREPFPRRTAPCELPPSVEPTAVVSSVPKIGRAAKVLAALATLLILGGLEALVTGAKILLGGSGWANLEGGLFVISPGVWTLLAHGIEKRLPARWRHPENAVAPALEKREEEEETVRVRA